MVRNTHGYGGLYFHQYVYCKEYKTIHTMESMMILSHIPSDVMWATIGVIFQQHYLKVQET